MSEQQAQSSPLTQITNIKADPALAPLAAHTHTLSHFRLWLVTHDINRTQNHGVGWITREQLIEHLPTFGIRYGKRNIRHLLQTGAPLYWTIDPHTHRIYLTGYVTLWKRLAATLPPDLVESCQPCTRVYVDVSGNLQQFTARMYNAWIDSGRHQQRQISRIALRLIWDRCKNTQRTWEQQTEIQIRRNYAQYRGECIDLVPNHAYTYATKNEETGLTWQLPNTYVAAQPFDQARPGKRRKARRARRIALRMQADDIQGVGLLRTPKRYYNDPDCVKNFKAIRRNMKRQGAGLSPRYAFLGRKRGIGIYTPYDPRLDTLTTDLHERHYRLDYTYRHSRVRSQFLHYWQEA